ncbi:MAG: HEPN domain-containing protein [Chitinivibrionia bacterium]|nr:HEPN domain-containing protein [Chitinivibrionia bacterium]
MTDETEDIVLKNIQNAKRSLASAHVLLNDDDFGGAVNRLYYCVFYCARALLANEDLDFKKHSGVISKFRENYIKTGKLDKRLSVIIGELFNDRIGCDYDTSFSTTAEIVEHYIEDAEYFLDKIAEYLKSIGNL